MNEKIIDIKDLRYEYTGEDDKKSIALDGVSFSVNKGELISILGHNGSGKSTLAKLLNAQITPTDGEIVDEALEIVEMQEYKKHSPHMLSGGQKQRVAIAGILAMKPDVIIFDESTAMLDPIGRKDIIDTILKLNKEENKTILYITHYMEEAVLADRVIVLNEGKIEFDDSPKKVFSNVETLRELGLSVPQVTELAYLLKNDGVEIPSDILTNDEMIEFLERKWK